MGLVRLPAELLGLITEYISADELFDLSLSCRGLLFIIHNDSICRKALQKVAYSPEAIEAQETGAYARGLRKYVKRREAVRTAKPFIAAWIGVAEDFIYSGGVLCYSPNNDQVRILDLHRCTAQERVLDVPILLQQGIPDFQFDTDYKFRPLHYADGVLSCLYSQVDLMDPDLQVGHWLIILDLGSGRLISCHELEHQRQILVRNTAEHLFYGIYCRLDGDNCLRWHFYHLDITTGNWAKHPVTLLKFYGSSLSREVCFDIFDGCLYAVSNVRGTRQTAAGEWNDFYSMVRLPLDATTSPETIPWRNAWRRHPEQGANDERWDHLQLVKDEASGELHIVECRREYGPRSAHAQRICYTKVVSFEGGEEQPSEELQTQSHPSWQHSDHHIGDDGSLGPMLSIHKCLVRFYNVSSKSFVDLVAGSEQCSTESQLLRLRVLARRDQNNGKRPRYWPPLLSSSDSPNGNIGDALHNIINTGGHPAVQYGIDERTLVYAPGSSGDVGKRPLVLISFDPSIRLYTPLKARIGWDAEGKARQLPGNMPTCHQHDYAPIPPSTTGLKPWMRLVTALHRNIPASQHITHLYFDMAS